ncbi:HdeD family acid-resistance protein [Vagococcus carniphilus]
MTSMFKSIQQHALLRSIAYILLGIAIFLEPNKVSQTILYLIVGYNVVMGVFNLISSIKNKQNGYSSSTPVAIFYFIFALILFLFAKPLVASLPFFLGLMCVIGGGVRLSQSLGLRQYVNVNWLPMFIYGAITIGAGVLLMVFPFSSAMMFFRFFGVVLTLAGISELVAFIRFRNFDM